MKGFIGEYIEQLHREKSRHRKVSAWTSMLALLVVFTVVWGLRVKGISLTNDTDCGIEEHVHSDICYELVEKCGFEIDETDESGEVHIHTSDCYEERLACEKEEHVHTVACLDIESLEEEKVDAESDTSDAEQSVVEDEVIEDELDSETELEEEIIAEDILLEEDFGISLLAAAPIVPDDTRTMITKFYDEYLEELTKEEPDSSKLINFGDFYVVTATGLRHKNRINETLEGGYNDNALGSRYLLYRGAPLTLVVFRDSTMKNYIYAPDNNDSSVKVLGHDGIKNTYNGEVDLGNNITAVYADVTGGNTGVNGVFGFERGNGSRDRFYTYVREYGEYEYRHSDIEISDGGFFKIQTRRDFNDGGYQVIKTRYDSYVSDVYKCNVYFNEDETSKLLFPGTGVPNRDGSGLSDDPDNAFCGPDKTVYSINNMSGVTQFELTSAFYCNGRSQYNYNIEDIDHVVFSVELSLSPMTSEITYYDKDDVQMGPKVIKDFAKADGTYDYTVTPLEVSLGKQSILDAMNKCPMHNGMDFNLLYREVNLSLVEPTDEGFKVKKVLDGDNTSDYALSKFSFELYDSDDNKISEVFADDETGLVEFPVQDFPIPGRYKYKIKEVPPEEAVEIEKDIYFKDYVVYDCRTIDVVVDVSLSNEILAVVESVETELKTNLVAKVSYYINGEEIDTSDGKIAEVHNEIGEYKAKNLIVKKEWIGNANHDNDRITFRIIRTKNGTETEYYDVGGNTVFELNNDSGWQMLFYKLPVIVGKDTYTYEVQETEMTEYVPTYRKTEADDQIIWTISNIKDEDRYLYIKKIWTDDLGKVIEAPSEAERVHIKLRRQYQEKEITLVVNVQSTTGGAYYSENHKIKTYVGGKVEFQLRDKPGGPTVQLVADMSKSRDVSYTMGEDNTYIVDITGQEPELVLQYNPVTESDIILWNTGFSNGRSEREFVTGSGAGQWVSTGTPGGNGDLRHAYSTCYSAGEWNSERNESGYGALAQKHRVENWAGARLNLSFGDNRIKAGEYYSFSAWMGYKREFTQEEGNVTPIGQSPTELKLQLYSRTSNGNERWTDIASIEAGDPVNSQTNWKYLSNPCFQIPEGDTDFFLVVNTVEEAGQGRYVDIYFDDIIIAPANYKIDGTSSTGVFTGERKFIINSSRTIPPGALEWQDDIENGVNIHSFTLEKSSDWMKEYKISDFGVSRGVAELPHRVYRYYIVEEFEDGAGELINPQNYKVFYEDMYVGYNTPETPMIVRNEYHAYVLPNTGGIGQNRIRWLGLLILLAGIPPALVNLVRKRGRPSG